LLDQLNALQDASKLQEYKDQLDVLQEELFTKHEERLSLIEQETYFGLSDELLKDTGIRTKIIKQYLPIMNKLINEYLQIFDFFVSFTIDENFNEKIRSRHRDDFSYSSFSEGEKARIDLALMFTWRQIAKLKNSTNTNLLILDETFDSSLDSDGVENLLKVLYTMDQDTNTFIISHKSDVLEGKFQNKLLFKKVNNFTEMFDGRE
jgi:ATPase subunit of ABC transporter with duplicated ATPase domains